MYRKQNKFNNRKIEFDWIKFDSLKEAWYYQQLKILEKAWKIQELELQPVFELQPKFKHKWKTIRAIKYIADFRYYDNQTKELVVVDVKWVKTQVYNLKKKMFFYKIAWCYRFDEI